MERAPRRSWFTVKEEAGRLPGAGEPGMATRVVPLHALNMTSYDLTSPYRESNEELEDQASNRETWHRVARAIDVRAPNVRGIPPEPLACPPTRGRRSLAQTIKEKEYYDNVLLRVARFVGVLGSDPVTADDALLKVLSALSESLGMAGASAPDLHEALACVLQVLSLEYAMSSRAYSRRERVRLPEVLAPGEFKVRGPWSVLPFEAWRSSWNLEEPDVSVNLGRALNDLLVGLTLNSLRRRVPNFVFYYGHFLLDCPQAGVPVPYIMKEYAFEESLTLQEWMVEQADAPDLEESLYAIFLQVFAALTIAWHSLNFVHNNLVPEFVRVQPLDRRRVISYTIGQREMRVSTRWLARIDNFTFAHTLFDESEMHDLYRRAATELDRVYSFDGEHLHTGVLNYATNVSPRHPRALVDVTRLVSAWCAANWNENNGLTRWLLDPLFAGRVPPYEFVRDWHQKGAGRAPPGLDVRPEEWLERLEGTLPPRHAKVILRDRTSPTLDEGLPPTAVAEISGHLASLVRPSDAKFQPSPSRRFIERHACTRDSVGKVGSVYDEVGELGDAVDALTRRIETRGSTPEDLRELERLRERVMGADARVRTLVDLEFAFGPIEPPDTVENGKPMEEYLSQIRAIQVQIRMLARQVSDGDAL